MLRAIRGRHDMRYTCDHPRAALQTVLHQPTYLLSCFAECRGGMFSRLRLLATLAQETANSHKLTSYLVETDPYSVSHFPEACQNLLAATKPKSLWTNVVSWNLRKTLE